MLKNVATLIAKLWIANLKVHLLNISKSQQLN